jgi:hypothetical protein
VPVEPGVTGALAKNTIEDSVDALRVLLDRARPSDFRRPAQECRHHAAEPGPDRAARPAREHRRTA